jgi:hypothetical protein
MALFSIPAQPRSAVFCCCWAISREMPAHQTALDDVPNLFFCAGMPGDTTLADLLKLKGCLQTKCHGCRRDLADRIPLTTAVSKVIPRLRCSECGSTRVNVYEAYR